MAIVAGVIALAGLAGFLYLNYAASRPPANYGLFYQNRFYEDWVRSNQEFMREHAQGGGGGGQPLTATPTTPVGVGTAPSGTGTGGGTTTPTGIGGVAPSPQGLEKGNAPATYGVVGR